ncbi:MAG: helix-turn-helix transcriptional regulator [Planctomycetota bacterium]
MKREPQADDRSERDVEAGEAPQQRQTAPAPRWSLLSNHAHVLVCLALDPDIRLRVAAEHIGITQRSVQNILHDLEVEGLVTRERQGRRNHYSLNLDQPLRHPLEAHRTVGELVEMLVADREPEGLPGLG